jgi:anthranilate phosphoribosyltransferase
MSLKVYLKRLMEERAALGRDEARALMEAVLAGGCSDVELAALVGALGARGETAEEVAGFVDAMRGAATTLPLTDVERSGLVDTCGTGGDQSGTFNISTAAALVAAAAGARVAKHGNRAVTSKCGSGDVLEALGVPVDLSPERAVVALREYGFAFLHAPSHHPAMRAVMPVRKALGVRTVFNVLGPLSNPAGARAQVMGVYAAHLVPLVADAMALLGVRHAFVVWGDSGEGRGMDEISIGGPTAMAEVREGRVRLTTFVPEDVGLERAGIGELRGGDAGENAGILRAIFAGERGPRRDVVLLNAAAVLVTAGLAKNLLDGTRVAGETIDEGKVTWLVNALSGRDAS